MVNIGQILSGTAIAREIRTQLCREVEETRKKLKNFQPGLAIVQVGGREDSNVYIRMKIKAANEIGIKAEHVRLPSSTTEFELLSTVQCLNNNPEIHGIIVQMPLDTINPIDAHLITDAVSPNKDVDGLNTLNEGRVAVGDLTSGFLPCTPNGVLELIRCSGINIAGTDAVVLGRSKIVGTPVGELLKWNHATVTICHSKTKNLAEKCRQADILVVAIGRPEMVKGSWIKPGAVVIDCGINSIFDASKVSKQRLVGDVAFDEAVKIASYITPVPGGVGPMTVAMLMKNTVQSAHRASCQLLNATWTLRKLTLNFQENYVPSDLDIVKSHKPKDIEQLAEEIGLYPSEIILYGRKKAKVALSVLDRLNHRPNGRYVVVTGITPTPLGEGKSTTTIGLAQALSCHLDTNTIATIRQPSQGPTFGIKGGAAGGGYSQVVPMDEFNLHLTGDFHAISAANNLLAAQIDTRIFHENTQTTTELYNRLVPLPIRKFSRIQICRLEKLGIKERDPNRLTEAEIEKFTRLNIDPEQVFWHRVVDVNDRFLRSITIGQSPTEKNYSRQTKFSITVASELMAIIALANCIEDLKCRIGRIIVALDRNNVEVTVDDLGVTGALVLLLKDALQPNLLQTLEGSPVMVHAGPFANIAHGCSSIIADQMALKIVGADGVVVTEAGFGSDIGLEKFFNIKCRTSGCVPNAIVVVVTIRALKMHGGGPNVASGSVLHSDYLEPNLNLVEKGLPNLFQHISNGTTFGVPVIVAINKHSHDSQEEIDLVCKESIRNGAEAAVVCTHWAKGGAGAVDLAQEVLKALKRSTTFNFLYDLNLPLKEKIDIIAKNIYGAGKVLYSDKADKQLQLYEEKGYGNIPICMAKTALSLSGDPTIKGAPVGFTLNVNEVSLSAGAGFVVPIVGKISTMPGLPTRPCFYDMDICSQTGEIIGLS